MMAVVAVVVGSCASLAEHQPKSQRLAKPAPTPQPVTEDVPPRRGAQIPAPEPTAPEAPRVVAAAAARPARTRRLWQKLAQCESGNRWHLASPTYKGGLQILPSTWRAFGGLRYASLPHLADTVEQIAVAERILDRQGWGAWPKCSRRLGLR